MNKVAVLGAGAWGTALAIQALRAGASPTLWARDPARAATMGAAGENPRLPGASLAGTRVTCDPAEALRRRGAGDPGGAGADICAAFCPPCPGCCRPPWWWPRGWKRRRCACLWRFWLQTHPGQHGGVLSGPNFAHEVAAGLPAASVVASGDAELRARSLALLSTSAFRLYGSADPVGVQVCGAAKNVVAIAAGAAMGAGLGENARAALVSRGPGRDHPAGAGARRAAGNGRRACRGWETCCSPAPVPAAATTRSASLWAAGRRRPRRWP